jgi:nuclear pore complex protein Nup133
MFVPDTTAHSTASLRNPRRRQRTNSDDSVKLPKAKRQRSALRVNRFDPSAIAALEHSEPVSQQVPQTASVLETGVTSNSDLFQGHLTLRGPKKAEKPGDNVDGTVVLVGLLYLS